MLDGKTIYKSHKPFQYYVTWESINNKGAVFGDHKQIGNNVKSKDSNINAYLDANFKKVNKKEDATYKVRLMKGLNFGAGTNQWSGSVNHNSEWNRLMLPIHERAKDKSWKNTNNVEKNIADWGIGLTDKDLNSHRIYGDGTYQLYQETISTSTDSSIIRGILGISGSNTVPMNGSGPDIGWSPVLELIK